MDRPHTSRENFKFFYRGIPVAFAASICLFWNSTHNADEIIVAIATPLLIFNFIPILLNTATALTAQRKKLPQQSLPFREPMSQTRAVPFRYKLVAYGLIGVVLSFFAGLSILLASVTYSFFEIPWASIPARHLAYILLGASAVPMLVACSFLAGVYYSGKFRNNSNASWLSYKASHPFRYWPTTA